jgi:hypothetical protein
MIPNLKTLLVVLLAMPGVVAYADTEAESDSNMDLRPSWSDSIDSNCSFLNDQKHHEDASFLTNLIDDKHSAQLRQDYQDLNRDYDLKTTYGLSNPALEQSHYDQMTGFAHGAMNQVQRYQLDQTAKDAKAAAEQNPDVAKPAEVVGGAAAVATGTPVAFKLAEDTSFQSKTNLARQKSEFNLLSGYLNASVQMNMTVPATQDPTVPVSPDPSQRDERYKVALNRPLPWDFSSGLSYGSTTSSLSATLSKQLISGLSAAVDSSRMADRNAGTVRLSYGLHF